MLRTHYLAGLITGGSRGLGKDMALSRLDSGLLRDYVTTWRPDPQSNKRRPRLGKVIAATATISDPDRQLRVLYQRDALRFPCPGPRFGKSLLMIIEEKIILQRVTLHIAPPKTPGRAQRCAGSRTG